MNTSAKATDGGVMPSQMTEFLVRLAVALHRHSMYPSGHPALATEAAKLLEHLTQVVAAGDALRIKVLPDALVVGDWITPPKHPRLEALAKWLHGHQLLSVTLRSECGEKELHDFLTTIGIEPQQADTALGAASAEQLERWPNILVEPVPYDAISRGSEDGEDGRVDAADVNRFWARVPDAQTGAGDAIDLLSADASQEASAGKPGVDQLIENHLPNILQAWDGSDENAASVRRGVSRLILSLDRDKLSELLELARSSGELDDEDGRREVTAEAVEELIQAAQDVSNEQVPIWLVRLLTKIGMYAENATEAPSMPADNSFGDLVGQLAGGWEVGDHKPETYEKALGQLISATPALQTGESLLSEPRPERIIQISLEIDDISNSARRAALALLDQGEFSSIVDLLEGSPVRSETASELWKVVATPERVRQLLSGKQPDFDALDRIIPRLGMDAAEPMLDVLMETESRPTRRELLPRLVSLGPEVGPLAVKRLDDGRWFVLRNMLNLLNQLDTQPAGFTPAPFLEHSEARVRHEAVKLALKVPTLRERAVLTALGEQDERTIGIGLTAAADECPAAAVPYVARHVLDHELSPGVRLRGVRALSGSRSEKALRALIRLTWLRKFPWRGRLAPPSPITVTALTVLAKDWPTDSRARRILRRAARSSNSSIRAALTAAEDSE
jgi:hypothetical protein